MEEIYDYIENTDNCQCSMDELLKQVITGEPPHVKIIQERIREKYGDQIFFWYTSNQTNSFRSFSNKYWAIHGTLQDGQRERERIVQKTAEIILEDIACMAYDNNTYIPSATFCNDPKQLIPEFLKVFMDCIAKKKRSKEAVGKRLHALIALLLFALDVSYPQFWLPSLYSYTKNTDQRIWCPFSQSWYECLLLWRSAAGALHHLQEPILNETFCQYIFNNANFSMAGISSTAWEVSNVLHRESRKAEICPHMRYMKSSSALTRGIRITDSVLPK